jgi:hypothetical protein
LTISENVAPYCYLKRKEEDVSFIFGLVAVICAILGAYLFLVDADLTGQLVSWWNTLLTAIGSGDAPFSKGVILLAAALCFAILAIIFDRRKRGVTDPGKP